MAARFEPQYGEPATASDGFAPLFAPVTARAGFSAAWPPASSPAPGLPPAVTPRQVLEEARAEARVILRQAHDEAANLLAAEAKVARQEQIAAFRAAGDELLSALGRSWTERLEQLEHDAAGLVTALAGQILHEHFIAHEEAILPVVREAVQRLADSARVQVLLAAHHEPAVRQAQGELAALLAEGSRLEIVIAEQMSPGGCVVHGDNSSLDARLETRLEIVDQAIGDLVTGAVRSDGPAA